MNGYMNKSYIDCKLCPRECGVDRTKSVGVCKSKSQPRVARAALHFWEEPCISGQSGSGAVFFSGCQLGCVFCQNENISHNCDGLDISVGRLTEIFLELQTQGANNINLVSATQFVPDVISAINSAKKQGLKIPVVYNSSGYEKIETLKMLEGTVDIYLPDFKYMSENLSKEYSFVSDYPCVAKLAIDEMFRQVKKTEFCGDLLKRGMIVRHLVLPGCVDDSKRVIEYLYNRYGDGIWLSIMNQYTPKTELTGELKRKLTDEEYNEVLEFAETIGVTKAYIQEGETADESFIPPFDYKGVNSI